MSFWEVTKFLLDGFWISLLIFGVTLLCGAPLGLPIAFCSMSKFKAVKAVSKVIVWIVRGVPLMLQIFIIYYVPGLLFQTPIFSQMDRFSIRVRIGEPLLERIRAGDECEASGEAVEDEVQEKKMESTP